MKLSKLGKIIITLVGVLIIVSATLIWYFFNKKFSDTSESKADYTVNAIDFIQEFQKNDTLANKKYVDKIVTINGKVFETELADTTVNVKISDTTSGAYIIFAFQQKNLGEAKNLQKDDSVSIKGSCSGGVYSSILETETINFKRCVLNKKY